MIEHPMVQQCYHVTALSLPIGGEAGRAANG